jgi:Flp pilus assembly protein TadD
VEAAEVRPEALFEYREGMRSLRRNVTLTGALGHLAQAVAIDPASPLPHAALAEVNWRLFQLTGEPDLLADSLAALGAAERRNPDLAEVHRAASLPKLRDGKTEEALAHLTRAIELAPTNAEAYRRLGNTQLAANRAELALAAYRRAVELEPGDYRNHQGLGSFYMHSQQVDYQEAARHFRRAAELEPEDPVLHFALGSALLDQGKFAEAEACLRRSLELQERPDTLNTLGVALMYQKRDAEAVPYLRKAAEAPPGEVLRWMNLATAHHHLGRKAEARRADLRGFELAERAVSQNPRDGYARASMALLCARLGERRRAESEAAQALLLTPADADTRWMAVKTYEFLGLRERALEVLARSTRDHLADIARHPDMAGLRADPRFQSMLGSFQSKSHDSRRQ